MFFLYNLIYIALLPLLILRDLFALDKNKLKTIKQKLGFGLEACDKPTIWLHGVSLGEIKIISPLAIKFKDKGQNVLVTSTTNTGLKELEKNFNNTDIKILPFPYDISYAHKKINSSYGVKKIILFESEFWPNFLNSVETSKIISLNTTISDKSFSRLKLLKGFSRKIFSKVDLFLAQSKITIQRLTFLGVSNTRLIGNIKINPENYAVDPAKKAHYQNILGSEKMNIVLGSSHKGEEVFVINALKDMDVNIILAPRHPERVTQVLRDLEAHGLSGVRTSQINLDSNYKKEINEVLVFDEVGDLSNLYSSADLAIVAGSIKYSKGHNFMEPIFVNTLSITGSKLENYKDLKEELCDTNIIETFNQPNQLRALVNKYKDEDRRREKLAVQKNALKNKSGSYDEIIKSIDEL